MNHKVTNVRQLYDDANTLYSKIVVEGADEIIADLNGAVTVLKNSWEGKDAGVQINNIIEVENAMVKIRNILANLAKDSVKVAIDYREIQNANRANFSDLAPLAVSMQNPAEYHTDERDTINITPEANQGKTKLDSARNLLDNFINDVRRKYDDIMINWQSGTGRNQAQEAFEDFMDKTKNYKQILEEVSGSIATALQNYTM